MSNLMDNIKDVCRICLTGCDNMFSLTNRLDSKFDNSPTILDALQNTFSMQMVNKEEYPEKVCRMCYGHIKLSYDLKLIYLKSQKILGKYIYIRTLTDVEVLEPVPIKKLDSHPKELSDYEENYFSDNTSYNSEYSNDSSVDTVDGIIDDNLDIIVAGKYLRTKNDDNNDDDNEEKLAREIKFDVACERSTSKKFVSCTYCFRHFKSNEVLAEHQKTCKNSMQKSFKSEICNSKSSPKDDSLKKIKDTQNVLECKLCNKVFKNNRRLRYHNSTQHTEEKKFVCKICGKKFHVKNTMEQHMDIHSKDVPKVVCPICEKSFHYKGGLYYHMKIHKNERNYNCNYCGRKFLNISGLKKHIRIHTGEKPYTCIYCGKAFISKNILDNHEKTHTGVKNHFCPYCEKGFITSYSLKVHISSHRGLLPCEYCKHSFLNIDVLKLHMKYKHKA